MEHFRRLGLADAVREASLLPFGWSDSAVFCTSLVGYPVERFDGVFALSDVPSSDFPEPAQWTAQFRVEAALRAALSDRKSVEARWGSRLEDVKQEDGAAVATVRGPDGSVARIRGQYLVGADGGRSTTRKALGVALAGRSHHVDNLQVIFDAPGLAERHDQGRAVQYWVLNPQISGLLGPLDTGDAWWAIVIGAPLDASPEWTEWAIRTMIGADVPLRIRSQDPWTSRMMIAERYRAGRCFLAGDAAHLNPPWGGFGANTGIGDAVDLGWKLAAAVSGWAGPALLDSYEAERRPAAVRAIAEAERNMAVLTPELSRPDLDGDSPAAVEARAAAAEAVRRAKTAETYTLGFVLGAGCPRSGLVVPDDLASPLSGTSVYRPSGAPGMRLPHLWLGPGDSLYDRLGPGFTLLAIADAPGPHGWEEAARERGIPLSYVGLHRPHTHEVFGARYLLVRPDQLVAWRGDDLPVDAGPLLDRVCGSMSDTVAPSDDSPDPVVTRTA
jgi:2-polyprenyl-6-methoxyphenol hydroxylase-like FAD-dependent oxidoreductase